MWMAVLEIKDDEFVGELLVVSFATTTCSQCLKDEFSIVNWASFPDPDTPGQSTFFKCATNFNPRHGIADEIEVSNYYGSSPYDEISSTEGPWQLDTRNNSTASSYRSFENE